MEVNNLGIRLEARGAGVPLWRIAKKLSISEPTLTRLLRVPLTQEKEDQIRAAIMELKAENEKASADEQA